MKKKEGGEDRDTRGTSLPLASPMATTASALGGVATPCRAVAPRRRDGTTPAATYNIHPKVFDDAIRPFLAQLEQDLGTTVTYRIIYPGRIKGSVNDIRLTISVTFPTETPSNLSRFEQLQHEATTRFLAWIEDFEGLHGLPPHEGGWWTRECDEG